MSRDVHSCTHWLRPRNSLPPPAFGLVLSRALLVSKTRRHIFVSCNPLFQVDPETREFTGPDITFVYPDFRTGIRGAFNKGTLVSGVQVEINATRCRAGFREIQSKVSRAQRPTQLGQCLQCVRGHAK
jgi:hypothetical protein